MNIMRLLMAFIVLAFVAGCGGDGQNQPGADTNSGYSSPIKGTAVGGIVEDVTGYTDVKAGRKAAEKIRAIGAQENKDFNEAVDINKQQQ